MWKKIIACVVIVTFLNLIITPNLFAGGSRSNAGGGEISEFNAGDAVLVALGTVVVLLVICVIIGSLSKKSNSPTKESKDEDQESKILHKINDKQINSSREVAILRW